MVQDILVGVLSARHNLPQSQPFRETRNLMDNFRSHRMIIPHEQILLHCDQSASRAGDGGTMASA